MHPIKIKYTLRFLFGTGLMVGLAVLVAWLGYWLSGKVFLLSLPAFFFLWIIGKFMLLSFPRELTGLRLIWQSDDPEETEETLAQIRERGGLIRKV